MLEWIISSTVLIAVIIALRFILKGRISPRLQYALWALVLVRLLLPFSIGSSSLSVMNQVKNSSAYQEMTAPENSTATVITPGNLLPGQMAGENTAPPLSGTQSPAVTAPGSTPSAGQTMPDQPTAPPTQETPAPPADKSIDTWTLLHQVWLGGSILMGVWFALTNLRFSLRLKKSRMPYASERKLPVYVCDAVDTPCLFGFLRPAVYLTEDTASDERTVRHAVEHELTHYYHKDHIWAVLRCVCLAVHWFNPLVWYAAFLSRNDAELACDESTIRRLGESERAEYGRTLLRLTCEKRTAILHTATTMTGSGKSIKERIALIVKQPKMAVYTLIAVLLIAAIAIACTFTGAKDNGNETNTQLWPENVTISCARFEYSGDNGGYKLITSEIAQFNSLRDMNLIPTEGKFTGEIIYRLILNWNEVSEGAEEYIILVGEDCLSVNGQLFLPNGFDFSEILAYFEGKYRYFDYELLYDAAQDNNGESNSNDNNTEQNQLTDEQIRANAIIKTFASLKAEDIKDVPGFMGTDYTDIAVLLNDLEKYKIDAFEMDQSFWSLTVYLSGDPEEFSYKNDERVTFYGGAEEALVSALYHSRFGTYTQLYFDYPALYHYIRQKYHTDHVIDEEALALYRDILTARAKYTIEERNSSFEESKFVDYEIMTFHLTNTFERDGAKYEVYEWEVAFITDNIDYPWVMNRVWVDGELRIRSYDSYPYLVVRSDGIKTEHDFFPWDTPLYGYDSDYEAAYDEIAANFVPENSSASAVETLPVLPLSDVENEAICSAVLIDLKTGWWKGVGLSDCTYEAAAFECVYRETIDYFDRFYGYAGYFRFDENGNCIEYWYAPALVTLDAYTKQVYNVWWPGDGAYYESDILAMFPDEIAGIVAEPNEVRYQVIRDRLLATAKGRMILETAQDTLSRLSILTAEDIKYISPNISNPTAQEIVDALGAALANRVEHSEPAGEGMFFTLEFYLSGGPDGYSSQKDEWVMLYAGLEENIVWIWHHESYSTAAKFFVEDEALYQLVRGTYYTEPVIDEEAFTRFGDILKDRAQKTVDQSMEYEGGYPLPYTGYEIVRFEKIDSFEQNGAKYEVYEWDVAFLTEDPMKVGWAGGMWLDSELRVRTLEQETYFVVCVSGDVVTHDFFFWDLCFEETGRENAIDTIIKRFSEAEN